MYRAVNLRNYDNLGFDYILSNSFRHGYATRNTSSVTLPKLNRAKSQYCILYVGCNIWNNIGDEVKNVNSLVRFKRDYKEILIGSG